MDKHFKHLRTKHSHKKLSIFHFKILCESLEDVDKEFEILARQLTECGIEFPCQTIGSELAPLKVRKSTSS